MDQPYRLCPEGYNDPAKYHRPERALLKWERIQRKARDNLEQKQCEHHEVGYPCQRVVSYLSRRLAPEEHVIAQHPPGIASPRCTYRQKLVPASVCVANES